MINIGFSGPTGGGSRISGFEIGSDGARDGSDGARVWFALEIEYIILEDPTTFLVLSSLLWETHSIWLI